MKEFDFKCVQNIVILNTELEHTVSIYTPFICFTWGICLHCRKQECYVIEGECNTQKEVYFVLNNVKIYASFRKQINSIRPILLISRIAVGGMLWTLYLQMLLNN